MYDVIMMTPTVPSKVLLESMSISTEETEPIDESAEFFAEAVFIEGKESLKPIAESLTKIKGIFDAAITAHNNKQVRFDPVKFWRDPEFKNLENQIQKVFGFRSVEIHPYVEKYNGTTKDFQSKDINAYALLQDRYPIDGLITDKGFYDKTHSIVMYIKMSLGLIKMLTADEILACILHEFGHNIDPAAVTIEYAEINILSKYIMDRKGTLTKAENKVLLGKSSKISNVAAHFFANLKDACNTGFKTTKALFNFVFGSKDEKKNLDKLRNIIRENTKDDFRRQNYQEAFADNFARMYGYGPQLVSAFKKIDKHFDKVRTSNIKKEKLRQQCIIQMITASLQNVHKTDVHRIRALIKEYRDDLNDPNIPDAVKKQLGEDMKILEDMLHKYTNEFSDFQNKVNAIIIEELDEFDKKHPSTPPSYSTDKKAEKKDDNGQGEKKDADGKDSIKK